MRLENPTGGGVRVLVVTDLEVAFDVDGEAFEAPIQTFYLGHVHLDGDVVEIVAGVLVRGRGIVDSEDALQGYVRICHPSLPDVRSVLHTYLLRSPAKRGYVKAAGRMKIGGDAVVKGI
jgi:hypothetical protein